MRNQFIFQLFLSLTIFIFAYQSFASENLVYLLEQEKSATHQNFATSRNTIDEIFDFPLSLETHFRLANLKTRLASWIWREASFRAEKNNKTSINENIIRDIAKESLQFSFDKQGHLRINLPHEKLATIPKGKYFPYAESRHSYKSILASEQLFRLGVLPKVLPLDQNAIDRLSTYVDIYTLASLYRSILSIKGRNIKEIESSTLSAAWVSFHSEHMMEEFFPDPTQIINVDSKSNNFMIEYANSKVRLNTKANPDRTLVEKITKILLAAHKLTESNLESIITLETIHKIFEEERIEGPVQNEEMAWIAIRAALNNENLAIKELSPFALDYLSYILTQ